MIQEERIRALNHKKVGRGRYVLYWMQASQRAEYNHALEFAILKANEMGLPVVVFFGLTERFPEANQRHYYFMLEGLREVKQSLESKGIKMIVRHQSPERGVVGLSRGASLVVVDRGYLKVQKQWRRYAAEHLGCPLIQVESDVVVPVEVASPKEEYAAATIRPKIRARLDRYLVPFRTSKVRKDSLRLNLACFSIDDIDDAISRLRIDRSVRPVAALTGGTSQAKKRLRVFIRTRLDTFAELRNDPSLDYLSHMSPYLHFGQISPLYIALKVREATGTGTAAYLEDLLVRRELSMNFVHYNAGYDSLEAVPGWARKTLADHAGDPREYLYSLEELEAGSTHDPYWNAAQHEMRLTGKMHSYMRMYWGKKIIEWTRTPEQAHNFAIYLNNKYELDGRDPNGFAGVAWCFGKHDRPWGERSIFGKIRYMNDKGLRRKFDADAYVERIRGLL